MTKATDVTKGACRRQRRLTPACRRSKYAEVLRLLKGADSVELKLSVPDSNRRSAIASLGHRLARCADPTGRLLRHPRPGL